MLGIGGGGQQKNFVSHLQKDTILYITIFCDFQYPLSDEPFLALLLYTDLYVVILKLFNFFGWQNIGGGQLPPSPVPSTMLHKVIRIVNIYLICHKYFDSFLLILLG